MKDENAFNAHVKKEIDKMGSSIRAMKISDRFHIGWSDFLLFRGGVSVAVESKFFRELPARPGSNILGHAVTGQQRSFFKTMAHAGTPCWVIIGYDAERRIAVVPFSEVPENGNWSRAAFEGICKTGNSYGFGEIPAMVNFILDDATDLVLRQHAVEEARCT